MTQRIPPGVPASVWVTLQLQEHCQVDRDHEAVAADIRSAFGDNAEFYLPIHLERVRGKTICETLVEGYVWVRVFALDTLEEKLGRLGGSIMGPLRDRSSWHFVSGTEIQRYKDSLESKLKEFIPEINQSVRAKVGAFKDMEGVVKSVDTLSMSAMVMFKMRSRTVTAPVKIINLEPCSPKTSSRNQSF